jgi:hypothetical protein
MRGGFAEAHRACCVPASPGCPPPLPELGVPGWVDSQIPAPAQIIAPLAGRVPVEEGITTDILRRLQAGLCQLVPSAAVSLITVPQADFAHLRVYRRWRELEVVYDHCGGVYRDQRGRALGSPARLGLAVEQIARLLGTTVCAGGTR